MRRGIALVVFLASCAEPRAVAPPAGAGDAPRPQPYPAECVDAVARSKVLGRALFQDDLISAWGTDVALAGGLEFDPGSRGWITTHDANGWVVHFPAEQGGELVERMSVSFAEARADAGRLTRHAPARPADPDLEFLLGVLETATSQPIRRCTERHNHVLLPGALVGDEGWYVYLLASTNQDGVLVVGGHVRRHVSEDGKTLLGSDELSKDCMEIGGERRVPEGAEVSASVVSNLLWPCPTEIHVWLSMLSGRPLFVHNRTGTWEVEGTKVVFFGK